MNNRCEARYRFEISRSEWADDMREVQRAQNAQLLDDIERWRGPLIARGDLLSMTPLMFIGPAQVFCRGPRPQRSEAAIARTCSV